MSENERRMMTAIRECAMAIGLMTDDLRRQMRTDHGLSEHLAVLVVTAATVVCATYGAKISLGGGFADVESGELDRLILKVIREVGDAS